MAQEYEDNIILPPVEFRNYYKPIPAPRTKKPATTPRRKPIPTPKTKIEQTDKTVKGYARSFEITVYNDKEPLVQLQTTRKATENHFKKLLVDTKGFKYVETLKL